MDLPVIETQPTTPRATEIRHPVIGVVLAILAAVLLGCFWLFMAKAQRLGTPASAAGFYAHVICFSLMVLNLATNGRWRDVSRVFRQHRALFLSVSLIGASLSLFSVHGLPMSSLGSLGILSSTDILFTLLLGWIFFHERLRWKSLVAVIVIAIGASVRITGGQMEVARERQTVAASTAAAIENSAPLSKAVSERNESIRKKHLRRLFGDLCFLAYAILMATNAFLIKRLLRHTTWDVVLMGNYTMRLTGFAIAGVLTGTLGKGIEVMRINHLAMAMVLLSGLMLVVQMRVYYQALHMIPVWLTKTFMMSTPVLYFLVEWAVFGVKPGLDTYVGAALVLSGALYVLMTDPLFRPTRNGSNGGR